MNIANKLWPNERIHAIAATFFQDEILVKMLENAIKEMRDDYERALAEQKITTEQVSGFLAGAVDEANKRQQRIAELESELDELRAWYDANDDASSLADRVIELEAQLSQANEKLALIWPGTWQPIAEGNTELIDPDADDDRRLYIDDNGTGIGFTCDSGELEGYFNLPDGYAVCKKVQL